MTKHISIIVPVFNEEVAITPFFETLIQHLIYPDTTFEILFINDGSSDKTQVKLEWLAKRDPRVRVISFSRNFGKEAATSAGLYEALGDAVLSLDADLQHPPELIPTFIQKWEEGAEVVIGVRSNNASDSLIKRLSSATYYKLMNCISETEIVPRATDFRLMDRTVVDSFKEFTEHNRMTRGLVDWLGFKREYISFEAPQRVHGTAAYGFWKLVKLATESFIAHSLIPLRLAGYLGILITFTSGLLGIVMLVDRFTDEWGFNFTGTAILADIILFLVGIVLMALGLFSFYIGQIYRETQNRPLYVIRKSKVTK